jgi:hypothetical protein
LRQLGEISSGARFSVPLPVQPADGELKFAAAR